MEKYIFDERNGLWYELQGDYYMPCLKLPEEEQQPIGVWGQRHLRYLKENRRVLLSNLQLSGMLNSYLADIDQQAQEMFERLVKQMAERDGVSRLHSTRVLQTMSIFMLYSICATYLTLSYCTLSSKGLSQIEKFDFLL